MDKTKIAVDVFNASATNYQNKFMDVSLYHNTFDVFCNSIAKKDAAVLELACGPGNITQYLLKQRPQFKILGTDLAPNMLELAKINNPSAEFRLMDCRDLAALNKKYDAIMCGFCLPYLSKEEAMQLISDAAKIINEGGVIYISTMEDDYNKSGWKYSSSGEYKTFTHYHQVNYLTKALIENGCTIIDLQRKEYPDQSGGKVVDLILIAKK
ncbi:MAG: class I SAM-dependent methyltransferase [Bacteroidia bacterium]